MKCYRMHEDSAIGKWVAEGFVDAVTIYRGYAVCAEHLEEMVALQQWEDGDLSVNTKEDYRGVVFNRKAQGESFVDYERRLGR